MDNLDILGVGNALVDETFYIEEDLVRKTNLNFKKSIISNAGINFDQKLEKRKKITSSSIDSWIQETHALTKKIYQNIKNI